MSNVQKSLEVDMYRQYIYTGSKRLLHLWVVHCLSVFIKRSIYYTGIMHRCTALYYYIAESRVFGSIKVCRFPPIFSFIQLHLM